MLTVAGVECLSKTFVRFGPERCGLSGHAGTQLF
jgi:hypothetical protein